jgi:hypothetical protein
MRLPRLATFPRCFAARARFILSANARRAAGVHFFFAILDTPNSTIRRRYIAHRSFARQNWR